MHLHPFCIYFNAQDAEPLLTCLIKIGHPQPPANLQIDNTNVEAFYKVTLKQKQPKAMNMYFYWLQDR